MSRVDLGLVTTQFYSKSFNFSVLMYYQPLGLYCHVVDEETGIVGGMAGRRMKERTEEVRRMGGGMGGRAR